MKTFDEPPAIEGFTWVVTAKSSDADTQIQHAVRIGGRVAVCGLRPSGWAPDLFSGMYCERCCRRMEVGS